MFPGWISCLVLIAATPVEGDPPPAPVSPPPQVEPEKDTGAPQPPPGVMILEGQVTNHIGAGQADVVVTVTRKSDDGGPGALIAKSTTDRLGDFVVRSPQPVHGRVIVTITAPNYRTLIRELRLEDTGQPPYLAETLEGKLIVAGRVVDAVTEKPLAHASVQLTASYKEWSAKTEETGRFTITGVVPGRGELVVEADGYGRERYPIERLEDHDEIIARLKPERVITFKTEEEKTGTPIPGVIVESMDEDHDDFRTGITDKRGLLTIHGVRFDTDMLYVRLSHDGYVSDGPLDRRITLPADTKTSTHTLLMVRAGRITGHVRNEQGQPLHGARVITGEAGGDSVPRDWADAEGRFTIHGVRPGPTLVTVYQSEYAPELATVDVRSDDTATLDVTLKPGVVIRGVIRDADAKPVSGAYIEATQWRGHKTLGLRAVSDHDGAFVIENAPRDEFEVNVIARGYDPIHELPLKYDGVGKFPYEITLHPAPDQPPGATVRVGETAPVLTMTTIDGKTLDLSKLKGKTIVLDFWATWCGPCVAELPHLKETYKRYAGRKDFVMIGVSLDGDEETLRDFLKRKKVDWPQVFGDDNGVSSAMKRYGVSGVPALFLIGPDGKLRGAELGGSAILKEVRRVLENPAPTP